MKKINNDSKPIRVTPATLWKLHGLKGAFKLKSFDLVINHLIQHYHEF